MTNQCWAIVGISRPFLLLGSIFSIYNPLLKTHSAFEYNSRLEFHPPKKCMIKQWRSKALLLPPVNWLPWEVSIKHKPYINIPHWFLIISTFSYFQLAVEDNETWHTHMRRNVSHELIYRRLSWLAQTPTVISDIIKDSDWWGKQGSVWLLSKIWSVSFIPEQIPLFLLIFPQFDSYCLCCPFKVECIEFWWMFEDQGLELFLCQVTSFPHFICLTPLQHYPLASVSTKLHSCPWTCGC